MRRYSTLLAIVVLLFVPIGICAQNTPVVLEPGTPLSRYLSGGNRDVFLVGMQPRQFLHLSIMQDGMDVLITVFHPDGTTLLNLDAPIGKTGLEEVQFVADVAGTYRIEVHPISDSESGRYDIKIEALRPARAAEERQFSEIQMLMKLDAERLRAESRQDESALFRIYADKVLVVGPDSHSSIGDRKAILGADRLAPHRSIEETMTIDEVKVLLAEDTAVVSSITSSNWKIGEQNVSTRFCQSATYIRRMDRWQLLASQVSLVNKELSKTSPKAVIKLDPKVLDDYAGVYQVSPEIRMKVYRRGTQLILEGVDGTPYELIPEAPDRFVIKGTPAKHIFVRDANGKVTHLSMKAMGQEIKATRIE